MITYNFLINDVCSEFDEVKMLYETLLEEDSLDSESGVHTVFSFCFVPVLSEALKNDERLAKKMFDYIEKMETDGDNEVGEVAEFTVLEEIIDDFPLRKVKKYMGKYTLEASKLICRYINNW